MRLWPKSLGGQMALLLGLALLVAQLANFALILNEREKLSLAQNRTPAVTRFASVAADLVQAQPEFRSAVIADASHRGARFALQPTSGIANAARDGDLEARLRTGLTDAGLAVREVRATVDTASDRREGRARGAQVVRLAYTADGKAWLVGRQFAPRPDPSLPFRLAAATALLYLIVLGATIWIAMRIARPLKRLTEAATAFGGRTAPVAVIPAGPADLRQAIEAFNAMNRRVAALLDEKDHMLGAIGHDLRTPLASLRIRVESMEPAEEREAAVAKIAEVTQMLEDILIVARTGRAREQLRPLDVAALADTVVEEYRELGRDVAFDDAPRLIVQAQSDLLRRALRNLIENALAYGGGAARVTVAAAAGAVRVSVIDRGHGIPEESLAQVLQPFHRLESSRNRATGGSGLGLAIASSIAETHGGRLELARTDPHGLTATIILPVAR